MSTNAANTTPVSSVSLLARARSLRARAPYVHPVVAEAYLRRAAELRLEAWARVVRSGPLEIDDVSAWTTAA